MKIWAPHEGVYSELAGLWDVSWWSGLYFKCLSSSNRGASYFLILWSKVIYTWVKRKQWSQRTEFKNCEDQGHQCSGKDLTTRSLKKKKKTTSFCLVRVLLPHPGYFWGTNHLGIARKITKHEIVSFHGWVGDA